MGMGVGVGVLWRVCECECVCDDYTGWAWLWGGEAKAVIGRFCLLCDGRTDGRMLCSSSGWVMAGIASPCVSPSYMPC